MSMTSGELLPITQVLLTERAFDSAQGEGIFDIQPNLDQMREIGEITKTAFYIPDITILRMHVRGIRSSEWDITYAEAPGNSRYFPATELAAQERGTAYISAGNLRQYVLDGGKKVMELTVKDWNKLGEAFADTIGESKTIARGAPWTGLDLAARSLGWAISGIFHAPEVDAPHAQRVRQSANKTPYIISRRTTK